MIAVDKVFFKNITYSIQQLQYLFGRNQLYLLQRRHIYRVPRFEFFRYRVEIMSSNCYQFQCFQLVKRNIFHVFLPL